MDVEHFCLLEVDDQLKLALNTEDSKILDVICKSGCDGPIIYAARNKHTDVETLDTLARTTKCGRVVESLLFNPNLPLKTRKRLCKKWQKETF
ncbi:MAG: hypothetical protein J6M60_05860 [Clostridia bacterium]|nr:hypothetical protein [Clostridia bacterium]